MRLVVKATLNIAERLYLKKNKNRRKSFALKFRYRKISTRLLQRPIDFGFFKTTMDPTVHLTRRKIDSTRDRVEVCGNQIREERTLLRCSIQTRSGQLLHHESLRSSPFPRGVLDFLSYLTDSRAN